MFLLDLLFIAANALTLALGVNMFSFDDYLYPESMETITHVKGGRDSFRADGRNACTYHGAMVPYSRDWIEIVTNADGSETSLSPTPEILAGHAMVFYKKVCGSKVEPTLFLGDNKVGLDVGFLKGEKVLVDEYSVEKPASLPQWAPQVMKKLSRVSLTDPEAKQALDALESYQLGKAAVVLQIPSDYLSINLSSSALDQKITEESIKNPSVKFSL